VLCSAGLDSAVLLADEARRGPVLPVYVSVGLAWEAAERRTLERLLRARAFAGVEPPAVLSFDMRDVYPPTHWPSAHAAAYRHPGRDVYLAGRNLVLLTKAGVLCAQRRLGASRSDRWRATRSRRDAGLLRRRWRERSRWASPTRSRSRRRSSPCTRRT